MENRKFKKGDLVIEKGKSELIMRVEGNTMKGGLPYTIIENEYTCSWEKNGPHMKSFKEDELELYQSPTSNMEKK